MNVLREILTAPIEHAPWSTFEAWWQRHRTIVCAATNDIDAAILGGFLSETLAPAFACGYHAALRALVPGLPTDCVTSLCVTERGGGHPRAIRTRLESGASGTYTITGEKRWATLSPHAGLLLVVASAFEDPATNRSSFRVVRVSPKAAGVKIVPMPEPPFVPEISHAEISFDKVAVSDADILPGDGYDDYVKPFRTIEDIHVHAAGAGYLVRVCRTHDLGRALIERLVHVLASLRSLAAADPKDPVTHIILAGLLAESGSILRDIDGVFAKTAPKEYAKFATDKPIFDVASRVRGERATKAWERLSK
ncbi:MAG: acyl-CoA dehydrogenase family protein [Polyangiaceae bacterium]|nr:acyl-CoA dehydrogenase family protein [Polyangiaceae bacterium]